MEDEIQVLDSQEEWVGLLHEDIHQKLVLKEMEIGKLQLENEVLEHKVSKLEEENQSLHVLMQLVQSQSIVHNQHVLSFTQKQAATEKFGIHMLKDNDSKILFYKLVCQLSYEIFHGLYSLLEPLVSSRVIAR